MKIDVLIGSLGDILYIREDNIGEGIMNEKCFKEKLTNALSLIKIVVVANIVGLPLLLIIVHIVEADLLWILSKPYYEYRWTKSQTRT